ncbi:MAG: DUF4910 domain-containing protein [Bacteroidota bacterium]
MEKREIIESYFDRLWPICRSLTGDGVRDTLRILQELIPIEIHETPSGTKAFDWTVPREWNIRDAYILTPDGRKVADFKVNNLHVMNYAIPTHKKLSWVELEPHLYTLPHLPEAIPYITSYYNENWGFCLRQTTYDSLPREGEYEVLIDSTLEAGSLTHGDLILKGESEQEVLFSTYVCHPSMANNELSGPLVAAMLYQEIAKIPNRKYTYRFVFAPETIGIINYLSRHGETMKANTVAGYVLTCVGDDGPLTFKRSKHKTSLADRAAEHVLKNQPEPFEVIEFAIGGSDERQYCSPGFNLPVGSLMRSMYKKYPYYHTSLDNKDFISFEAMERTLQLYVNIVKTLEINERYYNTNPYCEPQLGKRGLYYKVGGNPKRNQLIPRMLHLLSFADGNMDLIDIAEWREDMAIEFEESIQLLGKNGLLTVAKEDERLDSLTLK